MKFILVMAALFGMGAATGPASAYAQDQNTIESALAAKRAERWPVVGVMADVGVPDGAIGSLVVRPWQWFRVYGGAGSNSVSKGWRGGFSLWISACLVGALLLIPLWRLRGRSR